MDIIIVLEKLGYLDEEQSPSSDLSTYQTMVATWRHTVKVPPTEADMLVAWEAYEAELAAAQRIKDRETTVHELLPEKVYMPAMLEQAKADRAAGKILEPDLDEVVNIYSQILTDNPEPI